MLFLTDTVPLTGDQINRSGTVQLPVNILRKGIHFGYSCIICSRVTVQQLVGGSVQQLVDNILSWGTVWLPADNMFSGVQYKNPLIACCQE